MRWDHLGLRLGNHIEKKRSERIERNNHYREWFAWYPVAVSHKVRKSAIGKKYYDAGYNDLDFTKTVWLEKIVRVKRREWDNKWFKALPELEEPKDDLDKL